MHVYVACGQAQGRQAGSGRKQKGSGGRRATGTKGKAAQRQGMCAVQGIKGRNKDNRESTCNIGGRHGTRHKVGSVQQEEV